MALMPWMQQCDTEWAIEQGRWQLFVMPDEWKARYDTAVREEIGFVPAESRERKRALAIQTANQVAIEYKTEQAQVQAQIRAEQERQGRKSMKSFLISVGVAEVGRYLKKLHSNDDIFDDDLARQDELEHAVRNALEERLTGGELFQEAERIAREVVDAELDG
jgi:hypothetical protein